MDKIKIKVYAKINFSLNVVGKDSRYHALDSVMASINIFDKIIIKKRRDNLVTFKCKKLPQVNSATKACECFMNRFGTCGADIKAVKKIPFMCGVGGSSADASAVLAGMNKLYETEADLTELALSLGSDAPYMLKGGFARVSGFGEQIASFKAHKIKLLLILPQSGVSTKQCFEKFDEIGCEIKADNDLLIDGLKNGDFNKIAGNCVNQLEKSARNINEEVNGVFNTVCGFKDRPDALFLTGSGSGIAAVAADVKKLKKFKSRLNKSGIKSILLETIQSGIKL